MKKQHEAKDRFVVIMAGGRGERFWPVSRQKTPKQLITLLGGRSFLQQAFDRVRAMIPARNVFVITNAVQAPEARRQLPQLPKENVVGEPLGRDTCAAVALGAALVGARSRTGVMAMLPADHVIPDGIGFRRVLGEAFQVAERTTAMITIGIQPTEPATGYGYIEMGDPLPSPGGSATCKTAFYRAVRFIEKPNLERASEYVKSGRYRWNAGMFIWSFPTLIAGLEAHQPEMHAACLRWMEAASSATRLGRALAKDYPGLNKVSIDYALMEKAGNVVVADGAFDWDDLGSWTALARHLTPDADGNCAVGDLIQVDAARNIVFDARSPGRRTPIALVGVQDSILVQTDDATLLAHREEAQKVKELVKRLATDPKRRGLV